MLKRLTNGEFVLAILVASLFWIAVLAGLTSYAPTDPQKNACYQAAAKTGHNVDECKGFWEKTTSDPIAAFTLVLAVSTVGLWMATIWLYFAGERQLAHLKETSQRQLRAYVFLDRIDLKRFDIDGRWRIQIAWKNTGGTRTRRLIAKVSHDAIDLSKQPLETFDFHDESDAQIFRGLIGPNQSINPPPIRVANIHLFGGDGDDTALLVWGWAEYQDVFEDTIRRTEFSFRVRVEGDIFKQHLIWFESTEKHNAADEDCMYPPQSRT